jgi:hypothetical protein
MVGAGNSVHALYVIMVHTEEPTHSLSVITPDLLIKEFRSTRTRSLNAAGAPYCRQNGTKAPPLPPGETVKTGLALAAARVTTIPRAAGALYCRQSSR